MSESLSACIYQTKGRGGNTVDGEINLSLQLFFTHTYTTLIEHDNSNNNNNNNNNNSTHTRSCAVNPTIRTQTDRHIQYPTLIVTCFFSVFAEKKHVTINVGYCIHTAETTRPMTRCFFCRVRSRVGW